MTKVNANHASRLHVDHEVGQMAVSNAQNPVAHTQQSMRADEVGPQGQEGLRTVAHLQESSPRNKKKKSRKCFEAALLVCSRATQVLNSLQQISGNVLHHFDKVGNSIGTLCFPGEGDIVS